MFISLMKESEVDGCLKYFQELEEKTAELLGTYDRVPMILDFNNDAKKVIQGIRNQHGGICEVIVALQNRKKEFERRTQ